MDIIKEIQGLGELIRKSLLDFDPPLSAADALATPMRAIVREGLGRGGTPGKILEIALKRQAGQAGIPVARLPDDVSTSLRRGVFWEARQFEDYLHDEMLRLPGLVEPSFQPAHGERFTSYVQKYTSLRALYHLKGWRCPSQQIFAHIVPGTLLGSPIIGGIHERMLEVVRAAERRLEETNPDAFRRAQRLDASVGGFVPRVIAGTNVLSNHSFGLAIDIDPTWNPHLKGPDVLAALHAITGLNLATDLTPFQTAPAAADADRLETASQRLRSFLADALPEYETRRQEVTAIEARLAKLKKQGAVREAKEAQTELDEAQDRLKQALWPNQPLTNLNRVVAGYSLATVQGWAVHGIQTLSIEFVQAFLEEGAALGANWGGQWHSHKDVMHIELDLETVIPPDSAARKGIASLVDEDPPSFPSCMPD